MGSEGRTSVLGPVLVGGAMLIVAAGAITTLIAGWWGLLILGFGLLDLAAVPFVLRAISTARPPESADQDYNPYARED